MFGEKEKKILSLLPKEEEHMLQDDIHEQNRQPKQDHAKPAPTSYTLKSYIQYRIILIHIEGTLGEECHKTVKKHHRNLRAGRTLQIIRYIPHFTESPEKTSSKPQAILGRLTI